MGQFSQLVEVRDVRRWQPQAVSLGTTLVVALLVLLAGFALSSLSVTHVRLNHQRQHGQVAQNEASSLVHQAFARILADHAYGSDRETLSPGLTFDERQAVFSTNNVGGTGAVLGWGGRSVPREGIHLVAQSTNQGGRSRVEALFAVPPFPYAIASNVPVSTQGAVLIGGVTSTEDLTDLDANILPADLVSNSSSQPAIRMGAGAEVKGDLAAVGPIELDDTVIVGGQVRPGSEPAPVPTIELADYDPGRDALPLTLNQGDSLGSPLTGLFRHNGDLEVSGPLSFDNGLLFVRGDVSVNLDSRGKGGLHGRGALVATGRVTVFGGSQLSEESGLALLAREGVTISGDGRESSFFQGLIYTEGPLVASRTTLLGSLIVKGEQGASVSLQDTRAIHLPKNTVIEIPEPLRYNVGANGVNSEAFIFSAQYDPGTRQLAVTPRLYLTQHQGQRDESATGQRNILQRQAPIFGEPLVVEVTDELLEKPDFLDGTEIKIWVGRRSFERQTGQNQRNIRLNATYRLRDYIVQAGTPRSSRYTFDPNRFLSLNDKIRLVFWHEG